MPHDAVIIGGSYGGLSAAMQLVRARRRVLVIDDGRRRNRFAARAHGILAMDGRPGSDIAAEARAQVAANQPVQNQGMPSSQGTPAQGTPAEVPASPGKPAGPARGPRSNGNSDREDVLLLTDLIEEQEPKLGAAGPRPTAPAQPIPLPRIDPVRASEMPQPSIEPAPDTASPLVGAVVAGVTSSAFDRLSQVVKESVPEPIASTMS